MGYCWFYFKSAVKELRATPHRWLFNENAGWHNYMVKVQMGLPEQTSTRRYDAYDYLLDLVENFFFIWSGEWARVQCEDADQRMLDNAY